MACANQPALDTKGEFQRFAAPTGLPPLEFPSAQAQSPGSHASGPTSLSPCWEGLRLGVRKER